ncbi:MAG: enoyl-CoA hydratase/isomerase family protein, partial [Hyphomicrobium sp.]|nr:enoyl-CoA hydratase/isomerase family protein [Hyphomicrobium sp.]
GFSAGFDFSALETQSDGDLVLRFIRLEQLLQAVWNAPFVTLALAHGPCFGAAADLVAACGLRMAATDATFRMPGLRFGIALGTRRLAALVGTDAARSLLTSTRTFDAAEAQRIGFLTSIAGPEAWDHIVAETAEAACVLPEASLARMHSLTRQDSGRQDSGSRDMAALVASLAEPGLKARIQGYLSSLKPPR